MRLTDERRRYNDRSTDTPEQAESATKPLTDLQKKAVEMQKEIEEACIRHGLNLTIFENGIGFVDPKDNKIVMVWRPKYKPAPSETPPTQKPSVGNMSAFIFGGAKGSGRFMGNKRKHTVRGMKRR